MGPIICGVDDLGTAHGAARVAREVSSKLGLDLVFVRVVEDGAPGEKSTATAGPLEHPLGGASEAESGAEWLIEHGHPADRLVAVATETKAAFVVVGSHGPRWSTLGSISADVSRRAPCPVIVVPPRADAGFGGDDSVDDAAGISSGDGVTESAGELARLGLEL